MVVVAVVPPVKGDILRGNDGAGSSDMVASFAMGMGLEVGCV